MDALGGGNAPEGIRGAAMSVFVPPYSGVLLGALVEALSLRATPRLRSSTARSYFAGNKVKPETVRAVIEDVVGALIDADLVDMPERPPPCEVTWGLLVMAAEKWDELVGAYRSEGIQVPPSPAAGRAFARLLVVDIALRLAALRRRCGLGPMPDDLLQPHPGFVLRGWLRAEGLTRERFEERARVSDTTVDQWCDRAVKIDLENILDIGHALAPDDEQKAKSYSRRLRCQIGVVRLRPRLASLGESYVDELLRGLHRLTNRFMEALSGSKLPDDQLRIGEDSIVLFGRCFESTVFLRRAASRVETDRHWHAALISDDRRYVQLHAQQLAAIPEVRQAVVAEGLPEEALDAILDVTDGDIPPLGLKPDALMPSADSELVVLKGDASFKANNRETLAVAAELRGDIGEAVAHFRKAVEHEPTKAMWHFKLGAALGIAGQIDDAISECEIAAALEPGWGLSLAEIGIIYLNSNRPVEAHAALTRAKAAVDKPTAHLWFNLGLAELLTDRLDDSRSSIDQALELKRDPRSLNLAAEVRFRMAEALKGQARRELRQEASRLGKEAALGGVNDAMARWSGRRQS